MKPVKVIIEKHPDGYVAYPIGVKGVVVGDPLLARANRLIGERCGAVVTKSPIPRM